jgi:rare lipoprotein A
VLAAALTAASCAKRTPPPVPQARYTVGGPYEAGGVWRYPQESFSYEATGLATIEPRGTGLTADGERRDPEAVTAAHPTLQLPAILQVTNLDAGRQVVVRANDRGPDQPGRLIALTPRAAALLGIAPGGVARVRVRVLAAQSEALRDALGARPRIASAAPLGTVTAEDLPAPGAPSAGRGRVAPVRVIGEPGLPGAEPAPPPDRLPATAAQVAAQPGALWIDLGTFHTAVYAADRQRRLAGLGAHLERAGHGRSTLYRVRAGPFATVPEADAALDRARRAGVSDATITAE